MIGAGLLARNAVARGLRVSPAVKTSLAPGSKAVTGYLEAAGLMAPLETARLRSGRLRLHDLHRQLRTAGRRGRRRRSRPTTSSSPRSCPATATSRAGSIRSRGRRIWPRPPLVVAFALAGRVDTDLTTEPLGFDDDGEPVFLADIWPSPDEIRSVIGTAIDPELFRRTYATVFEGDERWRALPIPSGDRYAWAADSTYIAKPPFFDGLSFETRRGRDIAGARALAVLGDSVTTDHISPAGSISPVVAGRRRGSRPTASARSTSTRTGPGAASTR